MKLFVLGILGFLAGCSSLHTRVSEPSIIKQPGDQVFLQGAVLCQHAGAVLVEGSLSGEKALRKGRTIQAVVYSAEGTKVESQ